MDTVLALIETYVPGQDAQRFILVGSIGFVAFLFAAGLSLIIMVVTDPARRRLGALAASGPVESARRRWTGAFVERVQHAAQYVLPSKAKERAKVEQQLIHAGFRSSDALVTFYGIKTCLALFLGFCVLVATRWMPQLSSSAIILYVMLASATGLVLPSFALRKLVERRQKRLRNGFPDALDMLVICVEAGLSLTAALQRVADELRFSHPELAEELALVNAETRAGVERVDALQNLTSRTGLDDIRGLVSLLIQTLQFGTSVADTLRVYSEEFRDKRMQKAEEQAAKISTKLLFPLVICLFPSFFLVAIGPAIIRIVEAFSKIGGTMG